MKQLPLKFEAEALNKATMVKEIHDLDCVVCPYLRVTGGKHGVKFHCIYRSFCVPVRLTRQLSGVPEWCPRKKMMLAAMKVK